MLSQDFKEFVGLLIKNKAEYLIVGGYAVGIHGHPRYTGDLDIWLNPTVTNAQIIVKCLDEFGFSSFGLTVADFTKEGNVVQLGYPPLRIDLLTNIDGVSFNECYKNRKEVEIDELHVSFIGYQDLIKNKKESGRLRDLDDLENLK
ncbi:MAG: nucleotidyltransferase [Bacteroidetes bacterium]|nr:nucleotidyltransferase [Bacteroidota bacterium]